jgi:hypothetical protein
MATKRTARKNTKPSTKSIVHRALVQYYVAKDTVTEHVKDHRREYTAAGVTAGLMTLVQEVF